MTAIAARCRSYKVHHNFDGIEGLMHVKILCSKRYPSLCYPVYGTAVGLTPIDSALGCCRLLLKYDCSGITAGVGSGGVVAAVKVSKPARGVLIQRKSNVHRSCAAGNISRQRLFSLFCRMRGKTLDLRRDLPVSQVRLAAGSSSRTRTTAEDQRLQVATAV